MEIGNGKKMDSEYILGGMGVWLFRFYKYAVIYDGLKIHPTVGGWPWNF